MAQHSHFAVDEARGCPYIVESYPHKFGSSGDLEMTNFIGIFHILAALVLIVLVLIQDSKSDGALGIGGSSGSNSLLGATGAQSLAGKLTVWAAVIFAITCLTLSVLTAGNTKSVVEGLPVPSAPVALPGTAGKVEGGGPIEAKPEAAPAETQAPVPGATPTTTASPVKH